MQQSRLELLVKNLDHISLAMLFSVSRNGNDLIEAIEQSKLAWLRHVLRRLIRRLDRRQYRIKLKELLSSLTIHNLMKQRHQRPSIIMRRHKYLVQPVNLEFY